MTVETLTTSQGEAPGAGTHPTAWARIASVAVPLALIVGAWLVMHPYRGIVHDAVFYIGLALRSAAPDIYDRDLFFAHGSQGAYTLFTPILSALVQTFGQGLAAMIATAIGNAIWLSGLLMLVARMTGGLRMAILPVLLVIGLKAAYGGYEVLQFGEGYATPRAFAEGFTLWALWALAERRYVLCGAALAAGLALHPLMAVVGVAAVFIYLTLGDGRWALVFPVGIAAAFGLGAAGLAPFDQLLRSMDPEWLDVVARRNVYLFPSLWPERDWYTLLATASFATGGALVLTGWQRRMAAAVVITGLGGIALTIFGADLLHNVFAIQVQLYRAAWLLQVFGNLGIGLMAWRLWERRTNAVPLTALLAFAWVANTMLMPLIGAIVAVVASAAAGFQIERRPGRMRPSLSATIVGFAALAVAGAFAIRVYLTVKRVSLAAATDAVPPDILVYAMPIDFVAVLALAFLVALAWPRAARVAALPAAIAVLVLGIAVWDRRDAWSRGIEGAFDPGSVARLIPEHATVYFERDIRVAWNLLGRATYGAVYQGGGIAFSRGTAMAYRDAASIMGPFLGTEMIDTRAKKAASDGRHPALSRARLEDVCRIAPNLDFLLLSQRVDGAYAATWSPAVPGWNLPAFLAGRPEPRVTTYYLYDCARFRGGFASK